MPLMSTHTTPIETSLTPEQALLTDHIGNEVYSSHYAERKVYRLIIGCGILFAIYVVMLLYVMGQKAFYTDLIRGLANRSPVEEKDLAAV